ncbi:MAG: septum formation initiator family protein [Chitinophagaceae bacterium]
MKFLSHVPAFLTNKYFIASAAFIAWIVFFDRNDLMTQIQRRHELNDLQSTKAGFTKKINAERKELTQLQTNPATLEKYAREKYYMKRDNEELFIISPADKKASN